MNRLRTFALSAFFLVPILCADGQEREPLTKGPYNVGYKVHSLPFFDVGHGPDTIQLTLNIWYPTENKSGARMRLMDYLYFHESLLPSEQYKTFMANETATFKKFTDRNFGSVKPDKWKGFAEQKTKAFLNAPFASKAFPVILGRLRAFSTTYTNEFLASHGYIVCMINGVDDFPPDNRPSYYLQISKEIQYYDFVRSYLSNSLKIVAGKAGLMGFSGGGFSQFFAPMHQKNYDAVALLESGIFLDGDLFDIVSNHPYYKPGKFNTPLLFLYNKHRFEENASSQNFYKLNTREKFLVLFNDSVQHHWDFATEGIASALLFSNRPERTAENQINNFRTMNDLIVKFFNRFLKGANEFTLSPTQPTVIEKEGL